MNVKPIAHGTWQGYKQERRRGMDTCEECRKAWNNYYKKRRTVHAGNNS